LGGVKIMCSFIFNWYKLVNLNNRNYLIPVLYENATNQIPQPPLIRGAKKLFSAASGRNGITVVTGTGTTGIS
jgi:hypothetical protein